MSGVGGKPAKLGKRSGTKHIMSAEELKWKDFHGIEDVRLHVRRANDVMF